MTRRNNKLIALIVHLSDLHFCNKFQNTKAFPLSVFRSAGHHYKFLIALDRIFRKIPQQIQELTKLKNKPKINLLVVTGDLTTRARAVTGAFPLKAARALSHSREGFD